MCAEEGSIANVARRLGVPRSSLSTHINKTGNEKLRDRCASAMLSGDEDTYKRPDIVSEALEPTIQEVIHPWRELTYIHDRMPPKAEVNGPGSDVSADLDAIRYAAEQRFLAKARRVAEKEKQTIKFPHGPIALFFVSDQHIGGEGTDVNRIFEEQDMILKTPGSYVWQNGDIVDGFIMGRLIAENMNPSLPIYEQWLLAKHYLERFGDKLVAVCSGNHDMWHKKLTGIDYSREITPSGVLYDSDEVRTTVNVGEHEIKVWSRHKWKGSSPYNPTQGIERAARFDNGQYDVMVGSHVHRGATAREFILEQRRKIAIMTGTYKLHDSYAEEQGFEKNDASTSCALVIMDDGSFWATSNLPAVQGYMSAVYKA